jgi:hypothetical protein
MVAERRLRVRADTPRLGASLPSGYSGAQHGAAAQRRRVTMAKGQQRSNKETRKPKKTKTKTIAANPSQKGGQRGLENLKND